MRLGACVRLGAGAWESEAKGLICMRERMMALVERAKAQGMREGVDFGVEDEENGVLWLSPALSKLFGPMILQRRHERAERN